MKSPSVLTLVLLTVLQLILIAKSGLAPDYDMTV